MSLHVFCEKCYGCIACGKCDCTDESHLSMLGGNFVIAGALQRAFELGFDAGWGVTGEGFNNEWTPKSFTNDSYRRLVMTDDDDGRENFYTHYWRPGCGKPP